MSTRTASYVDAIDHLPDAARLVLRDVSWDEYEQLSQDLGARPDLRVTYDEGRLDVTTMSDEHEEHADVVLALARILSEEWDIPLETRGSATRKRRSLRKATEPDASFWIANAARVIGKRVIDLESDPPPDVVVEIDITRQSHGKLGVYAAFGVPEIWRYDGTQLWMYELAGTTYVERTDSRAFPGLTAVLLLEHLELTKTAGQTETLKAFRQRIRRTSR